jgi:endonuclease YncB( thermonuclease family)
MTDNRPSGRKLESLMLGKRVRFEFQGAGMYNRVRGVIYRRGENVNQEMKEWCHAHN